MRAWMSLSVQIEPHFRAARFSSFIPARLAAQKKFGSKMTVCLWGCVYEMLDKILHILYFFNSPYAPWTQRPRLCRKWQQRSTHFRWKWTFEVQHPVGLNVGLVFNVWAASRSIDFCSAYLLRHLCGSRVSVCRKWIWANFGLSQRGGGGGMNMSAYVST